MCRVSTVDELNIDRWQDDGGACTIEHEQAACGLNQKKSLFKNTRSIYRALANHQAQEDWELQPLARELQIWATRMNEEFGLRIPEVSLSVDWLRRSRLGHFRPGHNGFGLKGEIAINRRHLEDREFWQVLGTLLHELIHAWQQAHGKAGKHNYHNKEFREKARELGLIVDRRGYTDYEPHSPFMELLSQYGVNAPEFPTRGFVRLAAQGSSKLKAWVCGCMRIWVAVADCQSVCLKCGQPFERAR